MRSGRDVHRHRHELTCTTIELNIHAHKHVKYQHSSSAYKLCSCLNSSLSINLLLSQESYVFKLQGLARKWLSDTQCQECLHKQKWTVLKSVVTRTLRTKCSVQVWTKSWNEIRALQQTKQNASKDQSCCCEWLSCYFNKHLFLQTLL